MTEQEYAVFKQSQRLVFCGMVALAVLMAVVAVILVSG
jgi:hypothetical protein